LSSLRNAEFLANEVPGVQVPAPVIERMRRAQEHGSAAARAEGVAIAAEVIDAVQGLVQGVQISAAGGRIDSALQLLELHKRVSGQP
jgi:methionine synthase / methylenetetrahydrofolate reductase(NADPH)